MQIETPFGQAPGPHGIRRSGARHETMVPAPRQL